MKRRTYKAWYLIILRDMAACFGVSLVELSKERSINGGSYERKATTYHR
jgi:hypothetical protein